MFSIELSNFSKIDFCYIGESGEIVGNSFLPEVKINSEKEEIEISVAEKIAKEIFEYFDHKIWFDRYSNGSYEYSAWGDRCKIKTSLVELECPGVDFIVIPDEENYFSDFFTKKFNEETKGNFVCEVVFKTPKLGAANFTFVHFVKDSFSLKFNKIHGHYYYVSSKDETLSKKIADYLDESIIVDRDSVEYVNDYEISIKYSSFAGEFSLKVKKPLKWIILSKNPSDENIMEHVVEKFKKEAACKIKFYTGE